MLPLIRVLCCGLVCCAPFAEAAHYKLFVLSGQSNSLGVTNGGEADPSIGSGAADAGIKFAWHNVADASTSLGDSGGVFTTLQEQQGAYYPGSATHWGPEIEFARSLYRAGMRDFGVIKASRGGGGNTNWHKASSGHMYDHVVNTVNTATATLSGGGDTFEIVGFLYLQGESDNTTEAAAAGTRLKELVDNLRVDLNGATNMHAVAGGIAAAGSTRDTVRSNQAAIAASTADIDYFETLDQQANLHDSLHYNKAAKMTVGQRYAQQFFAAGIVSRHFGKLVFIGDSITQGGNGNPSYRYRVFENLANQGVPINAAAGYEFVGSVSGAYESNAGSTPDVNGQVFANQHDGHWGWRAFWENGRVALPSNRRDDNRGEGTILNWTGQASPQEYVIDSGSVAYPDPGASGTGNTGTTYVPDTAVILIGINDLAGSSSTTQVRDDIGTMVDQLQAANGSVSIFISEILHTDQGATFQTTVDSCNALLPALAASKTTASSPVWVIDTNDGFDPVLQTYDNVHPNTAGEGYVGDRIAGGMAIIEMPLPAGGAAPLTTEKAVGDFTNHYEGNEIWDAGFLNNWGEINGGGTSESLVGDESDLRYDHTGSGIATTLDGTATPWNGGNDGDWTFETRLKFNANPSGFVLWLCTDSHRALVEIYGDRTRDFDNNQFNTLHNNVDGDFHVFRVAHDSAGGIYHVWRDGVELTAGGVPYDQTGADSRMLLGDYTGGGFGDGYDVEIDYVAFDQGGAYLPVGDPTEVLAKYDADAGNPAAAGDIESPADQGWAEAGSGTGVVLEGVVDGGTNAWRLSDDSTGLNPAYNLSLTASQLEQMYLNGWQFEMNVRAVRGGGFGAWGVSTANDPGWGLTGGERVGFSIEYAAGSDAFQVAPEHGGTVTLAAGTGGSFHTIRAVGAPLSSQYEFFVDGVSHGFFDIKDGSSNSNYDDVARIASGSTGGTGRETEWNLVCLEANQPPIKVVSDGVNLVNEEGGTSDDFTLGLLQEPTGDVTITVGPDGGSTDLDLGAGPGVAIQLTFTSADWSTPQQVTVTAVDDQIEEMTELVVVRATAASTDPFFDGAVSPVTVTVMDNDFTEPQIGVTSAAFVSPKGAYVTVPELYHTFRIPSMIVAPDGSLLAWAEGRRGNGADPRRNDNAPIDLVMKRSTDNGATWGPLAVIDPGFQPNGWKVDFGDPTTVVDDTTDPATLILLYGQWQDFGDIHPAPGNSPDPADANQVVWVRTSTDSGQTWSERSQIIYPVGPAPENPVSPDGLYWRYGNPGPGNGIQLRWQEGANAALNGRLVIPAKRAGSSTPGGAVTTEPFTFYSDDHGATWQIGNVTAGPDANEDEVVELADGQVFLDARQNGGSYRRRHLSSDGGVNWGADLGDDVAITAVDTSLDRYSSRRDGDDRDRILFSGPLGPGRSNITVWTSYDEGDSFINPVQLDEGYAAYSVVRALPNGDIGVLVETDGDDGSDYGKIEYFGFGLDHLEGMSHPEQLSHYDGFGNMIDRTRGGTGWSGPWSAGATFTAVPEEVLGSASVGFDGFDRPRLFGRVDMVGAQSTERALSRSIDLGSDGCAYVSMLVSRQLDASPDDPADEEFRVELRDSGGVAQAAFGIDSEEAFFVDELGARQAGSADGFALSTSHLLVLKIVANAGMGDQVLLKAFPSGGFGSGAVADDVVWTVTGSSGENSATVLERIALVGSAGAHWSVDEIRIGETWQSVAGEDTDGDGLDDAWEVKHFGHLGGSDGSGDADSDGLSDAGEQLAGTDPLDGASRFLAKLAASGDDFLLTWPSAHGRSYRFERSPDLEAGNWSPGQSGIGATPPENSLLVEPIGSREFYRIGIE